MKLPLFDEVFTGRVAFGLANIFRVPNVPGCYVLTNIHDETLYIGQTNNLSRRLEQHCNDQRMKQLTSSGVASWFYYKELPAHLTYQTEQSLLVRYKFQVGERPPLNRAGP